MSNYLVLDIETTASNVTPETEPIEVVFRYNELDQQNVDSTDYEFKMKPEKPVLPASTVIHGMSQKDVDQHPLIKDQLNLIHETMKGFSDNTIVIGYNVQFDIAVLNQAMLKYIQKSFQPKKVIDILRLARKLINIKSIGGYKLDAVYYYLFPDNLQYLLKLRQVHSALKDVNIEEEVLLELWDKVEKIKEYSKCTIDGLLSFAQQPMLLEEWGWGKHRGKKIIDVIHEDRDYVNWFLTKCDFRNDQPDLVFTIKELLK
jgi:DNA polymerase-3 subunit epsilon